METHGLSGSEGKQNDHFTAAHQLVTKTKEGAVTTRDSSKSPGYLVCIHIKRKVLYCN